MLHPVFFASVKTNAAVNAGVSRFPMLLPH
jgi:hypothetical protein